MSRISEANERTIDHLVRFLERDNRMPHVIEGVAETLRRAAETIGEADVDVELADVPCRVRLVGQPPTLGQRLRRKLAK